MLTRNRHEGRTQRFVREEQINRDIDACVNRERERKSITIGKEEGEREGIRMEKKNKRETRMSTKKRNERFRDGFI